MWRRSQVEKLVNLPRHMIQDLCNQNTENGGLAFLKLEDSRPGYSRFNESEVFALYLVGRLYAAGFTSKQMESAIVNMFSDAEAFEGELDSKQRVLEKERAALDAKLARLEAIRSVVSLATSADFDTRVWQVMWLMTGDGIIESFVETFHGTEQFECIPEDEWASMRTVFLRELRDGVSVLPKEGEHDVEQDAFESLAGDCARYAELGKKIGEEFSGQIMEFVKAKVPATADEVRCFICRFVRRHLGKRGPEVYTEIVQAMRCYLAREENALWVEQLVGPGSYDFLKEAVEAVAGNCNMGAAQSATEETHGEG